MLSFSTLHWRLWLNFIPPQAAYGNRQSLLGKQPAQKCRAETRRKMDGEEKLLQKSKLFTADYSLNLVPSPDCGYPTGRWYDMYELICHSNSALKALGENTFHPSIFLLAHVPEHLGFITEVPLSIIKIMWWLFCSLTGSSIQLKQEGLLESQQTTEKPHWGFQSLWKERAEENKKDTCQKSKEARMQDTSCLKSCLAPLCKRIPPNWSSAIWPWFTCFWMVPAHYSYMLWWAAICFMFLTSDVSFRLESMSTESSTGSHTQVPSGLQTGTVQASTGLEVI